MTSAVEASIHHGVAVTSQIDPTEVEESLQGELGRELDLFYPSVKRALASWAEDAKDLPYDRREYPGQGVRSSWARDRYETPGRIYEQMAVSYDALDDDVVGNVADTSEAIAFKKVSFECEDQDQEDVWSQIGRDLDLDGYMRTAWRELFTCSQFYSVRYWGLKEYKVRGKAAIRDRKKKFTIYAPIKLGFLDPTRIVPVGYDIFGEAGLAWIASEEEQTRFLDIESDPDPVLSQLIVGKYKPTKKEEQDFQKEEVPTDKLWELNPRMVFRHTLTKAPYERWARIRMKSVFPLLDLKSHLREMERAWLRGGINFIVLVTRGTDERPTTAGEVSATTEQMRVQARNPVIVSDHRISIEIISPDIEQTLSSEKWMVLDERIMMRLWGTFQTASQTSNQDTSVTLARVIARNLDSRRHMLKRTIEKNLIRPVLDNPFNIDKGFDASCSLEFAPRQMELDIDPALITLIQELRDRGDLSRETVLTEFNFDQEQEARRRELEAEIYDDKFTAVNVPFDSPDKTTPGGSGRTGGRPPGTPQPPERPKTPGER